MPCFILAEQVFDGILISDLETRVCHDALKSREFL